MTSHQKKKQKLANEASTCHRSTTFDELSVDVIALIFEYLSPETIMRARLNRKIRAAATKTIITRNNKICIDSVQKYNAVVAMTTALPNLQHIEICRLEPYNGFRYKFTDGADTRISWVARTCGDVGILHSFRQLRELKIHTDTILHGSYPMLFDFPLLQKLTIVNSSCLFWDLAILAGLPLLKELNCSMNDEMTGNISSLSVLKGGLVKVLIDSCELVQGNFMDLADFPNLHELHLQGTSVIGDIRDIGEDDFPSLAELSLPSGVYGGRGYEFQHISDAQNVVETISFLGKRRPCLIVGWYASLSLSSPDWYEDLYGLTDDRDEEGFEIIPKAPLHVEIVKAGPRQGWRWTSNWGRNNACKVNWLDPEPSRDSSDYQQYIAELSCVEEEVDYYEGFQQPPSESEYQRIVHEFLIPD